MSLAIRPMPSSDVDLFADDVLDDPYPAYRELREKGPAVWLTAYEMWVLPRYEQVRAALNDHARFTSAEGVGYDAQRTRYLRGSVLESDPPEHDRLRKVLSDKLAPKALAGLSTRISELAEELVASVTAKETFDAVTELAEVLPITVVCDLIGLPEDARDHLLSYADALFNCLGPDNDRTRAAEPLVAELNEFLSTVMVPGTLRPDGWAAYVFEAADRGEIDQREAFSLMGAYITASMDTTITSLGNTILLFAQHPEAYGAVREEPSLVSAAFEESLRFESPVQGFFRRTTEDVDIDSVTIPAGARVLMSFASANRDERQWDHPEHFRVHRKPVGHLAMGYGVHGCAGQGLARLEAQAMFRALTRHASAIELAGPPVRKLNHTVRGLSSLPVTVR